MAAFVLEQLMGPIKPKIYYLVLYQKSLLTPVTDTKLHSFYLPIWPPDAKPTPCPVTYHHDTLLAKPTNCPPTLPSGEEGNSGLGTFDS